MKITEKLNDGVGRKIPNSMNENFGGSHYAEQ